MSRRPTRMVVKTVEQLGPGRVDLKRLRAMTEEEIMRTSPRELADLPDDFFENAVWVEPVIKLPISIRIDEDVLLWFRSLGAGYQTRMNAVLRSYMEKHTARVSRAAPKPKKPTTAKRS